MKTEEDNEEYEFPQDPLERCYLRGSLLFWGIWRALNRHNPLLTFGITQVLKKYELAKENQFYFLREKDPSDDLLKKLHLFYMAKEATIPNLIGRGKGKGHDLLTVLFDYSVALHELRDTGRAYDLSVYKNPITKRRTIKQRLPKLLSLMGIVVRKDVPEKFLTELDGYPKKETIIRLVAHIHGVSTEALRKQLSQARKKYPDLTRAFSNGAACLKSKIRCQV